MRPIVKLCVRPWWAGVGSNPLATPPACPHQHYSTQEQNQYNSFNLVSIVCLVSNARLDFSKIIAMRNHSKRFRECDIPVRSGEFVRQMVRKPCMSNGILFYLDLCILPGKICQKTRCRFCLYDIFLKMKCALGNYSYICCL